MCQPKDEGPPPPLLAQEVFKSHLHELGKLYTCLSVIHCTSLSHFAACLIFISIQPRGQLRSPPAAHQIQVRVKQDMAISISNKPGTPLPTSSWAGALWHQGTDNPPDHSSSNKKPSPRAGYGLIPLSQELLICVVLGNCPFVQGKGRWRVPALGRRARGRAASAPA